MKVAFFLLQILLTWVTWNCQTTTKGFLITSDSSCIDVQQCLINVAGVDPFNFINQCMSQSLDCDSSCFSEYKLFASCMKQCTVCPTLQDIFPWSCIESCKKEYSPALGKVLDCVFGPCKADLSYPVWLIIVIVILVLFSAAGLVFWFYKWKQRTSKSGIMIINDGCSVNKLNVNKVAIAQHNTTNFSYGVEMKHFFK